MMNRALCLSLAALAVVGLAGCGGPSSGPDWAKQRALDAVEHKGTGEVRFGTVRLIPAEEVQKKFASGETFNQEPVALVPKQFADGACSPVSGPDKPGQSGLWVVVVEPACGVLAADIDVVDVATGDAWLAQSWPSACSLVG